VCEALLLKSALILAEGRGHDSRPTLAEMRQAAPLGMGLVPKLSLPPQGAHGACAADHPLGRRGLEHRRRRTCVWLTDWTWTPHALRERPPLFPTASLQLGLTLSSQRGIP
jgi:hypothetical protein